MRCWRRASQKNHSSSAIHAHRTVHTAGSTGSPFGTRCCSSAPESQRPWLCTSLAGRLAHPPRTRLARPGRREPIAQPTAGASCVSQHGRAPPSPHHNLAAPAANTFGAIRYDQARTSCNPPTPRVELARGSPNRIVRARPRRPTRECFVAFFGRGRWPRMDSRSCSRRASRSCLDSRPCSSRARSSSAPRSCMARSSSDRAKYGTRGGPC